MAERVVIATLDIDEQGAVRSVKAVEKAEAELGVQTNKTADVFTARMFNMRMAAQAFLGSFTIAGGVFFLKGVVEDAVRADKHFASMAVSAANLKGAVAGMAAELLNLGDNLPKIESAMNAAAAYLRQEAAAHKAYASGKLGTLDYIRGAKVPVEEFMGPEAPPGLGEIYNPTDTAGKAFKELQARKQEVIENANALSEYSLASIKAASSMTELNNVLEQQGILLKGTADAFGENVQGIEEITFTQVAAAEATARLSLTLSEMGMVAQIAGQTLGSLAASGGKNIARMIAQILGFVAALAWSRVATYTAAAAASSTGLGAAVEGGTPPQFGVAAALWKKVALVSTFGAAFLGGISSGGGAGGGGESRGGFGGLDVNNNAGQPPNQITIIVNGSVVTVRDLVDELQDAIGDGAGGGRFVMAGA